MTGIVTNTGKVPIAGALVKMAHWLDGHLYWPSALTDATGRFMISFTAAVLASAHPSGGFVAQAQIVADGYEEFWRSLRTTGETVFDERFALFPMTRIVPGDSIVLRIPDDVGDCRSELAERCAVVRIGMPADGNLMVDVISADGTAARPPLEVCCTPGGEHYGNPINMPVAAGPDLQMFLALPRANFPQQSFLVTTSFALFRVD